MIFPSNFTVKLKTLLHVHLTESRSRASDARRMEKQCTLYFMKTSRRECKDWEIWLTTRLWQVKARQISSQNIIPIHTRFHGDSMKVLIIPPESSAFQRETTTRGVLWKKVFLEISKNSQENTCAKVSFLIKLQAYCNFIKKRLWHRCFPVNFAKFLRTPFLTKHLRWLLL